MEPWVSVRLKSISLPYREYESILGRLRSRNKSLAAEGLALLVKDWDKWKEADNKTSGKVTLPYWTNFLPRHQVCDMKCC